MLHSVRRLFVCWILMWPFAANYGEITTKFYLPLFTTVFNANFTSYELVDLSLVDSDYETSIQATVRVSDEGAKRFGGIPVGTEATSSTLFAFLLVYPIVIFSIIAAWPGVSWKSRLIISLFASVIIVIVSCIEIPVVLAASLDALLKGDTRYPSSSFSYSQTWLYLSTNGGRYVTAIVIAFVLLGMAQWLTKPATRLLSFKGHL